jgi:hypothetical protein
MIGRLLQRFQTIQDQQRVLLPDQPGQPLSLAGPPRVRIAEERQGLFEEVADVAGAGGGRVIQRRRALIVKRPVEVSPQRRAALRIFPLVVDESPLNPLADQRGLADSAPRNQAQQVDPPVPDAVQKFKLGVPPEEEFGRVFQEPRPGDFLPEFGDRRDDRPQIADQLSQQVDVTADRFGVSANSLQAIQMLLLCGGGCVGGVDEQLDAVVPCQEGFPLRVGQIGTVAKLRAKVGVVFQEVRFGLQQRFDAGGICHCPRLFANQMHDGGTRADVTGELFESIDRAFLAKVFLNLDVAASSSEIRGQCRAKARISRCGFLEFSGDHRQKE